MSLRGLGCFVAGLFNYARATDPHSPTARRHRRQQRRRSMVLARESARAVCRATKYPIPPPSTRPGGLLVHGMAQHHVQRSRQSNIALPHTPGGTIAGAEWENPPTNSRPHSPPHTRTHTPTDAPSRSNEHHHAKQRCALGGCPGRTTAAAPRHALPRYPSVLPPRRDTPSLPPHHPLPSPASQHRPWGILTGNHVQACRQWKEHGSDRRREECGGLRAVCAQARTQADGE